MILKARLDHLVAILENAGFRLRRHRDTVVVHSRSLPVMVTASRTVACLAYGGERVGMIDDLRISSPGVVASRISDALGGDATQDVRAISVESGLAGSGAVRVHTAGCPAWIAPNSSMVVIRPWGVEVVGSDDATYAADFAWSRALAAAAGTPLPV